MLTICPAPVIVANVNPFALLVLPADFPSTIQSRRAVLENSVFPLQSSATVQRSLPTWLHIQSYVPCQMDIGNRGLN